jgi:hypothetical protein
VYPRGPTGQGGGFLNRVMQVRLLPRVPWGAGVTEAWISYKDHDGVRFPGALQARSSEAERTLDKRGVGGSSPPGPTGGDRWSLAQMAEPPAHNREVLGSTPRGPTGGVAELIIRKGGRAWFMPAVPKTATRERRGFKSLPFRREGGRVVEVAEPLTRRAKAPLVRIQLFPLLDFGLGGQYPPLYAVQGQEEAAGLHEGVDGEAPGSLVLDQQPVFEVRV